MPRAQLWVGCGTGWGESEAWHDRFNVDIISHSERALKADEPCHALAVEIGSPELNTDNTPSIFTLLSRRQGLFVVDTEASTVRLIHFTLQKHPRPVPSFSTQLIRRSRKLA